MNDIVTALSFGAAAVATGAIEEVGRESYQALKNALLRVVSPDSVAKLEQKPDSKPRQGLIAEDLADAGKAEDPELAALARKLIAAVKDSTVAGATGVSLKDIEAVNLRLERIAATGTGVAIENARLSGDIEIKDIGAGTPTPGKTPRR